MTLRLIYIREAAAMLGIGKEALKRRLTLDRQWVKIYGDRLRVYPIDHRPNTSLRFDADEIARFLIRLQKRHQKIDH